MNPIVLSTLRPFASAHIDAPLDPGRLADFTDGVETMREVCRAYTPEAVAAATGIEPDVTRRIVREFRAARGAWYGRIGLCTQQFGTLASWLVYVINGGEAQAKMLRGGQ